MQSVAGRGWRTAATAGPVPHSNWHATSAPLAAPLAAAKSVCPHIASIGSSRPGNLARMHSKFNTAWYDDDADDDPNAASPSAPSRGNSSSDRSAGRGSDRGSRSGGRQGYESDNPSRWYDGSSSRGVRGGGGQSDRRGRDDSDWSDRGGRGRGGRGGGSRDVGRAGGRGAGRGDRGVVGGRGRGRGRNSGYARDYDRDYDQPYSAAGGAFGGQSKRAGARAPADEDSDEEEDGFLGAEEYEGGSSGGGSKRRFDNALSNLKDGQAKSLVIRKEGWEKLFALMETPADAHAALELMRGDATVRNETGWDWAAQGYGQTVLQFVAAAGSAGAPQLAKRIVTELATELKLNVSGKDYVASLMRKLVNADGVESEPIEELYALERSMRGKNTAMAVHEMSRVYRREGNHKGVIALIKQVDAGEADAKPDLMEDLETWLNKRGIPLA